MDELINFFSNIDNKCLNITHQEFNVFINHIITHLNNLKLLSFFDLSKPEFIFDIESLSKQNIISITPISYFNIFELFLQYIVINQLSISLDTNTNTNTNNTYNISLITYNINIFSSRLVFISQLRAISCLSLSLFDIDNFLENKISLEIIIANSTHFILPSF